MIDRCVTTADTAESLEPPCIVGLDVGWLARDQDHVARRTDGRLLAAHFLVNNPGVTFHEMGVDEERRVFPDALFLRRLTDDRGLREAGDLDSHGRRRSVMARDEKSKATRIIRGGPGSQSRG